MSTLSGGQRRRLDIAMGLIHAPRLLFLDEPSTGLDPQSRANLQQHIRDLRTEHGTTVVLTTHYLDEADSLAERVIVIDGGRMIADDTPFVLMPPLPPGPHAGCAVLRNPVSVIFTLMQPLFFLVLFAPLLPGTPGPAGSPGGSALQWFVPGVVVMSCLFGTSVAGSNLLLDMQTGAHERLLVTPLRRPALLVGRALKEVVPILAQTLLLVVVCVPFGFRPHPLGAAVGLLVLAVFGIGAGALSYALALAAKTTDWLFWAVQQALLFPLLLLSGMLLPLDNGPAWLRALSRANPLSYVVDAERALFDGRLFTGAVLGGLVAALAVAALGLFVGTRAMRRAT